MHLQNIVNRMLIRHPFFYVVRTACLKELNFGERKGIKGKSQGDVKGGGDMR
ncbi:hypothetical protein SAMN05192569_100240 [Parageobacillus thermantarcticus]|uniref:Uncharacterized protein n=1 Tax=Parageobacillus thermantarcticus TaxID=186116 RepID=A0A1I0SL82_9BACL|nr:hypothetical protein SAMN05192569_100240 [Parageobacillus thermantarcticus]